jgi:uncharacterized protein YozE (UPF0346 family)
MENLHYDLFEHYELIPKDSDLYNLLCKYAELDNDYTILKEFHKEVELIGYTFDYYLDAEPYGLRPIGIELNQLVGWENN